MTSRIDGFRKLSPDERRATLGQDALDRALPLQVADGMIENVVGRFELPLGVALNFTVNDKDYLVPMAVEEPSVVAAASFMARLARGCGGFRASVSDPVMRAQVQLLDVDPAQAKPALLAAKDALIEAANACDPVLVGLGGGCRDIEVHVFDDTPAGPMVVAHLLVDVRDAMGANTVNTMAERLAPEMARLTGGRSLLRILSNLADTRLARAEVTLTAEALTTDTRPGAEVAKVITEAYALAAVDPYRAATHNKGIMNGIDPVVVATGNDWRAIEAGAHAFAARSGRYTSLTKWSLTDTGGLHGVIELPMALGLVGGATKTHPSAQAALQLMDVHSAGELAGVVAAVGLAQNLAALRALATEGIQRGHMALHARNIAITAGATGDEVDRIAKALVQGGDISVTAAQRLLS
ncbi:hydroxymethylglutaryl-CoA reductase, degradative [Halovulum sp. GXIMD14793]